MDVAPTTMLIAGPNIPIAPALALPLALAIAIFVEQGRTQLTNGDRPCPHCRKIRVHRATACPNPTPTLPAAAVVSTPTQLSALPPPPKYVMLVKVNPAMMPKTTGDVSVIVSYRPREGILAPPAHFIAQGPPPGIPTDSALEVLGQLEFMNLLAALRILGPNIARQALEFIADGTIQATPVDKILLECEPSLPAVDTIHGAVEQASRNTRPTAVVAASPSTMMTGAQTLAAVQSPQNIFGETLRAVNDNVSVIETSRFLTATAQRSPKIGVLGKVHPCGGLVINFPGEEPISSDDDDEE
uniref:Uncharacterized protein n=1 Tax=Romanomermis culicivorax TaxID=13658 RepID=A0A915JBJ8_ROMCU